MENIRAENTAEHTWGLIMLLMVAWPDVPSRILFAAQIHDSGERATGDMPGPTKWKYPKLGMLMDEAERRHMDLTLPKHLCRWLDAMSETDWAVIEFFDRAEFCVSMSRERRLGNTYAMFYFGRSYDKMQKTWTDHYVDFLAMDTELVEGMSQLIRELDAERSRLVHLGEVHVGQ
jgi:5'-deoxynucleotidase YfbR-like HD superfamily hydrolase